MSEVEKKVDEITNRRKNMDNVQPQKIEIVRQKKDNKSWIPVIALLGVAAFLALGGIPSDWITPTPDEEMLDADVQLYMFKDWVIEKREDTNYYQVNVELYIMNIGDETALNISVFVRARDHYGNILFFDELDMTTEFLRENEQCSGVYSVKIPKTTIEDADIQHKVSHLIEISWDGGRNSYLKDTIL